ncbi:MAG TPA: condensation domain-containing protein, partial [Chitinispirillaceae bacterium]|nr:condensation domain-containing protein [Chitinispirillaceae bacterium]
MDNRSVQQKAQETQRASAIQQQFWLVHQMNPTSPAYNSAVVFNIKGALDCKRLENCVNTICMTNEILRSIFVMDNEELVRVVLPFKPVIIDSENLEGQKYNHHIAMQKIEQEL